MQVLADNQVKHIEDRLSKASLTNASLSIDILDHICCMIEDRLDLGLDYSKAEKEAFTEMGVLQIQAIEQEIKMLTQNTLIMKKRTKIIGLVAIFLMASGFIMKTLHLAGAGVTWGVGVLTAVFGFALFLTVDRFSYEKSSIGKLNGIIGFLGAGSFVLSTGFKLLHQPGAHYMIAIGGVVLLVYYVISNLVSTQDNYSK